jgi:hypothetical protein
MDGYMNKQAGYKKTSLVSEEFISSIRAITFEHSLYS